MKGASFLEGVAVALTAAMTAALGQAALGWLLSPTIAARLMIPIIAAAYLMYLLRRSSERVGRVTTLAVWSLVAALLWITGLPSSLYFATHLGLLWAVRSLYFHQGPLAALADLGLTGLAVTASLGAWLHTGSLFLAVWCLFLIQALFVLIPSRLGVDSPPPEEDPFERAHRSAETAVRKLVSQSSLNSSNWSQS